MISIRLIYFGIVISGCCAAPLVAQAWQKAPYIACADQQARLAKFNGEPIEAIQSKASAECEQYFAPTVEITVDSMIKSNAASARPLPALPRETLRNMVRPKLRNAFALVIQSKVPAYRAQR